MYLTKETLARHVGLDKLMQTSLREIEQKAKKDKTHRFENLYRMLNEESLRYSWKSINKNASAGIDKITAKEFKENFESNIHEITNSLRRNSYHAKLVKRVDIPKDKNKTRPLGIPVLADKLVQSAAAKILESIYEQDFVDNSYGYRRNLGPQKAVKKLTDELQNGTYSYIVEADIKGFFNNMNHEWIIKMLGERVNDRTFLRLIKKWLKAGILHKDGQVEHPVTGTPQGGIISPILANIYLHYALDIWFEKVVKPKCKGGAYMCRYADDFACTFRYKEDAEKFYNALDSRLSKFNLELAKEKTNIISFSRIRQEEDSKFDFLGFEFRWGMSRKGKYIIKRRTSPKKLKKSLVAFKEWCKENRNNRIKKIIDKLNLKLRGYYNHYGIIGNSKSLWSFFNTAMDILYKWLNRRSQRRSFNYEEFEKMIKRYGILKPRIVENGNCQIGFDTKFA
jgi:RNA-directed DNA polymerase